MADNASDLLVQARQAYQWRAFERAETLCKQVLTTEPASAAAFNLLGLVHQAAGRHQPAVEMYSNAIAIDASNASFHYNIAHSYEKLDRRDDAAAHFKAALVVSPDDVAVENFLMQDQNVAGCARQAMAKSTLPATAFPFGTKEISALAKNLLLRSAMQTVLLRGVELEFVFTHLRLALLSLALDGATGDVPDDVVSLFCALAEQCFINEYVYANSEREATDAARLRDQLQTALKSAGTVTPVLIAAVGAYFPLHRLDDAKSLFSIDRPQCVVELLDRQVREPLEEAEDRNAIPALTTVEDATSLLVMSQYEENPYPRWTVTPRAEAITLVPECSAADVLLAGCGTGRHAFEVTRQSPHARFLAVDISRASLAYARRKAREEGLHNVEFAQADILKSAALGRSFDHIECIGVLHHLADPSAGLDVLLSLLKPNGTLRLGLYSEAARRAQSIVEARDFIAAGGYQPTPDGIRSLRQTIITRRSEPRWRALLATSADFYSMSGCRNLLFNVVEHRFTIPQIAKLLKARNLALLDFQIDPAFAEQFRRQFSSLEAATDLDQLHAFEQANPAAFQRMYVFTVRRNAHAGR